MKSGRWTVLFCSLVMALAVPASAAGQGYMVATKKTKAASFFQVEQLREKRGGQADPEAESSTVREIETVQESDPARTAALLFVGSLESGALEEATEYCTFTLAKNLGLTALEDELREVVLSCIEEENQRGDVLSAVNDTITYVLSTVLQDGVLDADAFITEDGRSLFTGNILVRNLSRILTLDYEQMWKNTVEPVAGESTLEISDDKLIAAYLLKVREAADGLPQESVDFTVSVTKDADDAWVSDTDLYLSKPLEPVLLPEYVSQAYYGWWGVTNCTGTVESLEGSWWDVFARLYVEYTGEVDMVLWDEEYSLETPHCYLSGMLFEDESENVFPQVDGGWIYRVYLDASNCRAEIYDTVVLISGSSVQEDNSFDFIFYLRPWGDLWEDEDESMLPKYYADWYLPLIEEGKAMPDSMEITEEERK